VYQDSASAWLLADDCLMTHELTTALVGGPPALVLSNSCESAMAAANAGEKRYENQTFDLGSAFLKAGVQAYVGTLWSVEAEPASAFSLAFYTALLQGESLGKCMRKAKNACLESEWGLHDGRLRSQLVNWLAFVLIGNPRLEPGSLLPALRAVAP
jgi:CHAT domain-containing protein